MEDQGLPEPLSPSTPVHSSRDGGKEDDHVSSTGNSGGGGVGGDDDDKRSSAKVTVSSDRSAHAKRMLRVSVLKGKDLPQADSTGESDPYFRLWLRRFDNTCTFRDVYVVWLRFK